MAPIGWFDLFKALYTGEEGECIWLPSYQNATYWHPGLHAARLLVFSSLLIDLIVRVLQILSSTPQST
jgi:hypothetical protein